MLTSSGLSLPVVVRAPSVPFVRPTQLTLGRLYTIQGSLIDKPHRFSVNFLIGGRKGNIALHIDHRFDQRVIVRNSFVSDAWQTEERAGGIPLACGQKFTMLVLIENARFMIAYNNKHFTEFLHRLPPILIDTLSICGDVQMSMYIETQTSSSLPPPLPKPLSGRSIKSEKIEIFDLPDTLSATQRVLISGVPKKDTFEMNLETKADRTGDKALHISCRFGWSTHVVMNSHIGGSWGSEVRPSNFHLQTGRQFVFEISSVHDEFRIVQDGCYTAAFPERQIKSTSVTALTIKGDVHVSYVSF